MVSAASFEKIKFKSKNETLELESALKCMYCYRDNHEDDQCWVKNPKLRPKRENKMKNYRGSQQRVNSQKRCYNCDKRGHISRYYKTKTKGKIERNNAFYGFVTGMPTNEQESKLEYVDSGATKQLAPNKMDFIKVSLKKVYDSNVKQADCTYLKATHVGERKITHAEGTKILLSEMYLVPKITAKLISVNALNGKGFVLTFSPAKGGIRKGGKTCAISRSEKGWVIVTYLEWKAYTSTMDATLFHERMGYVGPNRLRKTRK